MLEHQWQCDSYSKVNQMDLNAALNLERWPGLSFPVLGRGDRVRPASPATADEASTSSDQSASVLAGR